MSWLKRLFGDARESPAEAAAGAMRVTIRDRREPVVVIPELDFIGQHASSSDGRFTLVWHDRFTNEGRLVPGRYILLDEGAVAVEGEMARPQDGKVANHGTFVLNDWGSSDSLSGTFHAFRRDGSPIVSRSFSANLLNNGLSRDGGLAVCQTCNAPGSPDSSVLAIFDLAAGEEIACWVPESGWASGYEFPGGERVRMLRRDRPSLDYSLQGDFIDRRLWFADEVRRGTLYVIRLALAEGEEASGVSMDALRDGIAAARAEGDERFEADAWRLLGEVEEVAGEARAALEAWDRALAVNPRIGVARRAAALRKGLGS